ncbi:MAG: prepilin-type N-terminal cleavage/methylation domain-containing protein [Candidatus Omnitrophica bacterium]|jgi:prepilin-type N-terminal cleavage/methylation domain-containing protein|nr:prepilin-type N-terminal cleavage/methylation domain-containing protein [Candidatus Omnitrophota bacterium]
MSQRIKGFTLIELIIVVVIISILALIAIPKYYANVTKAERAQVYSNLVAVRQVALSYYAVYGVYKGSFPITVALDGETIAQIYNPDPSSTRWNYNHFCGTGCLGACNDEPSVLYACRVTGVMQCYGICIQSGKTQDWVGG